MNQSYYPTLYQLNTRVWLTAISKETGKPATLDDIPDAALDQIAEMGFDWVWFLSVWATGQLGQQVSRENAEWRKDFEKTLPDLQEQDIRGSGFAIAAYHVHPAIGGNDALERLRERLQKRDLKLMLDFVPNHMGPDHPWVYNHPEYFIAGTENDLKQQPRNFKRLKSAPGDCILAYGRDP